MNLSKNLFTIIIRRYDFNRVERNRLIFCDYFKLNINFRVGVYRMSVYMCNLAWLHLRLDFIPLERGIS